MSSLHHVFSYLIHYFRVEDAAEPCDIDPPLRKAEVREPERAKHGGPAPVDLGREGASLDGALDEDILDA